MSILFADSFNAGIDGTRWSSAGTFGTDPDGSGGLMAYTHGPGAYLSHSFTSITNVVSLQITLPNAPFWHTPAVQDPNTGDFVSTTMYTGNFLELYNGASQIVVLGTTAQTTGFISAGGQSASFAYTAGASYEIVVDNAAFIGQSVVSLFQGSTLLARLTINFAIALPGTLTLGDPNSTVDLDCDYDNVVIADTTAQPRLLGRTITGSLHLSPAITTARRIARTISAGLVFSPGVTANRFIMKSVSVGLTLTPTVASSRIIAKAISVGLTLTPAVSTLRTYVFSVSMPATAVLTRALVLGRSFNVQMPATPALARTLLIKRTVSVGLTLTPTLVKVRTVFQTVTVGLTLTPALATKKFIYRTIQATLALRPQLIANATRHLTLVARPLVFTASITKTGVFSVIEHLGISGSEPSPNNSTPVRIITRVRTAFRKVFVRGANGG